MHKCAHWNVLWNTSAPPQLCLEISCILDVQGQCGWKTRMNSHWMYAVCLINSPSTQKAECFHSSCILRETLFVLAEWTYLNCSFPRLRPLWLQDLPGWWRLSESVTERHKSESRFRIINRTLSLVLYSTCSPVDELTWWVLFFRMNSNWAWLTAEEESLPSDTSCFTYPVYDKSNVYLYILELTTFIIWTSVTSWAFWFCNTGSFCQRETDILGTSHLSYH